MQIESTCYKTLQLQNFCKMLGVKGVKLGPLHDVIFQSSSKQLQNNIIHCDQTTIETYTLPAICIFKR